MICPYYLKSDESCVYLNGYVKCEGSLTKIGQLIDDDKWHAITECLTYECPITGENLGTKDELNMILLIHQKLGMYDNLGRKLTLTNDSGGGL